MNVNKTILFVIFLLISSISWCQDETSLGDDEQVVHTINKYITGAAYNQEQDLLDAFLPGANMFLDHPDKPLFILKIEDYAQRAASHNPGQFNGRVTNILSIERFEGIAMAKLEVIIPSMEKRFIDFLLLKKIDEGWKIISKTAASQTSLKQLKKVLLIVSNAQRQGDSELAAGNSFSEVAIAYSGYTSAGYHVDFVSPNGGAIPLAYINPSDSLQLACLYNPDFMYAIKNTKRPSAVFAQDYAIVQFTGGSAPIFDIPQNQDIQDLVMKIYEEHTSVLAAVCHGTSALVNLKKSDGNYLVDGKTVNGVPDSHESKHLPHYQQYPFIIEDVLRQRGAQFRHSALGTAHMEVDGRLVTGQNSLSSWQVTFKSIEISQRSSE